MLANLIGLRWIVTTGLMFAACSTWAATTSYFIYDESGHVIGEYDANGNAIQEHVYLGDRPVAVVQGGSSTGGTVDYVTTDQLNTPRAITDSSQAVMWSWNSDPFGNGQPTGLLANNQPYNLRFPGQYYDAETGHSYNYFRDYDPAVGRYLETDPTGINGGLDLYTYSDSNPVAHIDPKGLCLEDACLGEGAAAWAAFNAAARAAAFAGSAILAGYEAHKQCEKNCDEINQEIDAKVDELIKRYSQALEDKYNLFQNRPTGPFSWAGHKFWYEKVQGELRNLIDLAKALGCTVNPEAEQWAGTPFPDSPQR